MQQDDTAGPFRVGYHRFHDDVALNFQGVSFLNSSNIAKLLKLRKIVTVNNKRKLMLCAINTHVWGVFLVTGLDKLFDFADDVASGLASLQIGK